MVQQEDMAKQSDRRNYFRIDDVTILYYRLLHDEEGANLDQLQQLSVDKLTLKARFDSMTRELAPLTRSIEEGNPKLAQYLTAMDKKLNMLSEVLMNNAVDELHEQPQQVNISAGGLSFTSQSVITPGSLLELRIVLLPSNVGIYSHAKVVACRKDEADESRVSYKVAVEFVRMDEEFRDLISRHVLKREQAALMSGRK